MTKVNHAILVHALFTESQQEFVASETQAIGRIKVLYTFDFLGFLNFLLTPLFTALWTTKISAHMAHFG